MIVVVAIFGPVSEQPEETARSKPRAAMYALAEGSRIDEKTLKRGSSMAMVSAHFSPKRSIVTHIIEAELR